jgi:transposase
MRPTGSPEELERRRQRAITLLNEGFQPVDISKMIGVDRRSVRRWKSAYLKKGEDAIKAKPAPGRPTKLTPKQMIQLEQALLKGAKATGFSSDLWTCPRIAHLISKRFSISYHVDHIGRLLKSLGWTPKKPQRRAIERNEEQIQRWIKTEWPRIKKKPLA